MTADGNNGLTAFTKNRFIPITLLLWTLLLVTSLIWNVFNLNQPAPDSPGHQLQTQPHIQSEQLTTHVKPDYTKTNLIIILIHASLWLLGLIALVYEIKRNRHFASQQAQHEQAIKEVAIITSSANDNVFFQQLVKQMARQFNARVSFIGILNKNNEQLINSLAVYVDGEIIQNIEYPLQGSPCFSVSNKRTCIYLDNVQQQFPDDELLKEFNAQNYTGKILRNYRGEALGIILMLDIDSAPHSDKMSELFDIYASRAAAEMTRRITEQALHRIQKMEAISELSGGIAHDLNNQLGIIIGYLDFLKEHLGGEQKQEKWVDTATNAALHCTDITRQLLSFSRTASHQTDTLNINMTLQKLQPMIARTLGPTIKTEYFLSDNLWLTELNPAEFQDALLNIINNTRDAMPAGGKLLIETSNKFMDEQSAALNPLARAGEYVQIMISDNGCGMSLENLERIFEPFYTTKAKGKNTGLGMAMVYGFVKRGNGFINIDSEIDCGTILRLYLPRTRTSTTTLETDNTNEVAPRGNETILIVDDEVDLLHLADNYLSQLGYKTILAESAQQALTILARHRDIDLLFSDVVMPGGINGYELAQQVTREYPQLKILLTSGLTASAVTQDDQVRFAAQMLSKPYRKINLAKRIRLVLNKDYTSH